MAGARSLASHRHQPPADTWDVCCDCWPDFIEMRRKFQFLFSSLSENQNLFVWLDTNWQPQRLHTTYYQRVPNVLYSVQREHDNLDIYLVHNKTSPHPPHCSVSNDTMGWVGTHCTHHQAGGCVQCSPSLPNLRDLPRLWCGWWVPAVTSPCSWSCNGVLGLTTLLTPGITERRGVVVHFSRTGQ